MSKCCTFSQKKFLVCVNIPGNKTVSDSVCQPDGDPVREVLENAPPRLIVVPEQIFGVKKMEVNNSWNNPRMKSNLEQFFFEYCVWLERMHWM